MSHHVTKDDQIKIILIAALIIFVMAVIAILASCNTFETGAFDCEKAVGCIIQKPGC